MPLKDSQQSERTIEREAQPTPAEEIETPIETAVQKEAEHEFETTREFPEAAKKGIVSVNGEDVGEVHLRRHDRAA